MKRQLKKSVIYSLYAISFILLFGGITFLAIEQNKVSFNNYKYISKGILDYERKVPVVSVEEKIVRPYLDTEVKIVKDFYDYQGNETAQENALIYYEGVYMPSSGISYSKGSEFNVLSIYKGKVKEIKEDELLGNVITIEHENGLTSIYQSVSNITVKEGDEVLGGQVIAKSSTSNISTELGNHLYLELIHNGISVNPENYYNKTITEI